jgi:hypothetical protein
VVRFVKALGTIALVAALAGCQMVHSNGGFGGGPITGSSTGPNGGFGGGPITAVPGP